MVTQDSTDSRSAEPDPFWVTSPFAKTELDGQHVLVEWLGREDTAGIYQMKIGSYGHSKHIQSIHAVLLFGAGKDAFDFDQTDAELLHRTNEHIKEYSFVARLEYDRSRKQNPLLGKLVQERRLHKIKDAENSGHWETLTTWRSEQPEQNTMRTLAFVLGLWIATFGAVGFIAPLSLIWVAQHAVSSGAFCAVGAVRVAFGIILISVASRSRSPNALQVLGWIIVVAGISTVLTGLLGIERARAIIGWWMQQGHGLIRLIALLVLALGAFVAYACAPPRRGT